MNLASDIVSFAISLGLLIAYHGYLRYRLRKNPAYTVQGANQLVRTAWVRDIMHRRDGILVADDVAGHAGHGQRASDPVRGRLDTGLRAARGFDAGENGVDAAAGERPDGVVTAELAQLAHRRRGEVVVGVLQLRPACGGQLIALGRSPPALVLPRRCGFRLRVAGLDERVEVPAHTGCRQSQLLADAARGDGTGFQQELDDGTPGVPVGVPVGSVRRHRLRRSRMHDLRTDFHNTSVTQFQNRV